MIAKLWWENVPSQADEFNIMNCWNGYPLVFQICLALIALATATPARLRRGIVQQEEADEKSGAGEEASSGYHHEVEHEHAKSHQTIKFHHFHPVPVYVKKEHQHLLKHPLEKGASAHKLKQIHPKTEQQHSYGLVLENHGYEEGIHGRSDDHSQDQGEHAVELEHASGGEAESEGWSHAEDSAPVYETKSFQEDHYQYNPSEYKSGHEESY